LANKRQRNRSSATNAPFGGCSGIVFYACRPGIAARFAASGQIQTAATERTYAFLLARVPRVPGDNADAQDNYHSVIGRLDSMKKGDDAKKLKYRESTHWLQTGKS
jgi:hypothetical protein